MEKRRKEQPRRENDEGDGTVSFSGIRLQQDGRSYPTPDNNTDFEFRRYNSSSPNSNPEHSFPADLLFNNGQLMPHAFPFRMDSSRNASCTGSTSSYSDSSSSSSRNSRQNSLKKSLESDILTRFKNPSIKKPVLIQTYSEASSRQSVAPGPTKNYPVKLDDSGGKKADGSSISISKKVEGHRRAAGSGSWFGRRFFRSILSACKECHALEPVATEDDLPRKIRFQ